MLKLNLGEWYCFYLFSLSAGLRYVTWALPSIDKSAMKDRDASEVSEWVSEWVSEHGDSMKQCTTNVWHSFTCDYVISVVILMTDLIKFGGVLSKTSWCGVGVFLGKLEGSETVSASHNACSITLQVISPPSYLYYLWIKRGT